MNPIAACVRKVAGLTDQQRTVLILELQGAALPMAPDLVPSDSEKDRQRAVGSLRTHVQKLQKILAVLDDDAREYVADIAAGGSDGDDVLARNARAFDAHAALKGFETVLWRLSRVDKPTPSAFKMRREMLIAEGVMSALHRAGLPTTAADTGVAADCFRAVAEYAGVSTSDSPRYWLAKVAEI